MKKITIIFLTTATQKQQPTIWKEKNVKQTYLSYKIKEELLLFLSTRKNCHIIFNPKNVRHTICHTHC